MSYQSLLALFIFTIFFQGLIFAQPISFHRNTICTYLPVIQDSFSIEYLIHAIKKNKIDSVEKALCLMPQKVRSQFVLVHSSQSAQASSLQNPRVILFDEGGENEPIRWAISYNGHAKQSASSNLEIIKFDMKRPVEQQMEFIEVELRQGLAPHVSENPKLCLSCHQFQTSLPRPLWDSKGFFPTAYGQSSAGGFGVNNPSEAFYLRKFIKHAQSHPRYQQLESLNSLFNYKCTEAEVESQSCFDSSPKLVNNNNVLAMRLAHINRRRVAHLIQNSENYQQYKYAIMASLLECPLITEMLPNNIKANHAGYYGVDPDLTKRPLDIKSFNESLRRKNETMQCPACELGFDQVLSIARSSQIEEEIIPYLADTLAGQGQWGQIDEARIARLRYLFEGRGLSMAQWGMDLPFSQGFYRFQNGRNDLMDLNLLAHLLAESDAQLRPFYPQTLFKDMIQLAEDDTSSDFYIKVTKNFEAFQSSRPQVCEQLKRKSLEAF